ncbi:Csc1-like protein rxw8 [Thalictrum thalictroides]|uniref:Csc1-like protein rxw8 n=1 Tax=Thalictrum thalictroides TaxID=46969 RepID=A0A7J6UWD9_THATH|nr:Csc1-like protein rxw8 [Thalictrum thalictroides]
MNVDALLTSAGINIFICIILWSLYSILRKQPENVTVYFGRKIIQERMRRDGNFCIERILPSASWIVKAWRTSEEEILAIGGLDAVVFFRIVVFSIRIFSIAAVFCMLLVLPLNYYGQEMIHKEIHAESLDVFTVENVKEGSKWLWAHCLALYIISVSACILLYSEYWSIARMRVAYITRCNAKPSHFAVLVRSIPPSSEESHSDSVKKFFTNYHASSYLSHQMVYRSGTIQKLMNDAENMYRKIAKHNKHISADQICEPCFIRCNFCGGASNTFKMLKNEPGQFEEKPNLAQLGSDNREKECAAAFVFFKTRYSAFVASMILQSSNPMLWVTDMAPEPYDVYWSNLWIPYRLLWIRKIAIRLGAVVFMVFFLAPVTFVQGLSQLDELQKIFPFLKGILRKKYVNRLVTGYLPSVVLMLFLYTVPPTMMLFSTVEGTISRSNRKRSACHKILYFYILNVFFVSVLSGSVISGPIINKLDIISSPQKISSQLATAVPTQATFFITYVLTSGWASLSSELIQLFALLCNFFYRFVLCNKDGPSDFTLSFPYHTEVPKLLLFGLLGFTYSILAPLILPLLVVYFSLSYIVYRNQFINVYIMKYESGGLLWPTIHNTTVFSLVVAQIIALCVFGLKKSPVAAGFIVPLVILTLLFNEYCRQRFYPLFRSVSAQELIEMDRKDERHGRMEEIYEQMQSAYCQFSLTSTDMYEVEASDHCGVVNGSRARDEVKARSAPPTLGVLPLSRIQQAATWISMLLTSQERNLPK